MQGRAVKEEKYIVVKAPMSNKRNRPIGSITIRKTSNRKSKYIKTANGWVLLHHYRYNEVNGPIPIGQLIAFKNGNNLDCRVENLELTTRNEMMNRNRKIRVPNNESVLDLLRQGKRPNKYGHWV